MLYSRYMAMGPLQCGGGCVCYHGKAVVVQGRYELVRQSVMIVEGCRCGRILCGSRHGACRDGTCLVVAAVATLR